MFLPQKSLLRVPGDGLFKGIAALKRPMIVKASPQLCLPIALCNQKHTRNAFHTSAYPLVLQKTSFHKPVGSLLTNRLSLRLCLRQGSRKFHSAPRRQFLGGRDPFNSGDRHYKFSFSFDTWGLVVAGIVLIVTTSIFLMVLPYLFVVLFPFIIAAIAFYGIKSYVLKLEFNKIKDALSRSSMKLSAATRKQLLFKENSPHMESLKEILDRKASKVPPGFFDSFKDQMDNYDLHKADRFLEFLSSRIDESLCKNENNIRSIILGKDSVYRPDMVKLFEESHKIMTLYGTGNDSYELHIFQLMLEDDSVEAKPIGLVLVVAAVKQEDFEMLGPMFKFLNVKDTQEASPMVIAVKNIEFIPKIGFITDIGETGRGGTDHN